MHKIKRQYERFSLIVRKALWRLNENESFTATALFIFGVQRSGTTMLKDCFDRTPELEVYGEASPAMHDWRIRDKSTIRQIVGSSRKKVVVFKPLTDSHRVDEILSYVPTAKAIWMYRRFEDRANSAVVRFGNHNQEVLTAFCKGERLDEWQGLGLSDKNLTLLKGFDYPNMTPQSASAVFWYLRNSLYFEQGLEERDDVLLLSYEDLVTRPGEIMPGICQFANCTFYDAMVNNIHSRSVGRAHTDIDERVVELCEPMYEKLRISQQKSWASLGLSGAQ